MKDRKAGGSRRKLSVRERKLVKGVVAGKSPTQAAREAGYTEATAAKKSFTILQRPIVQSFLTDALERAGLTPEKIMQPVLDALQAKARTSYQGQLIEYDDKPDHEIRLEAYDRISAAFGAIPQRVEMPEAAKPSLTVTINAPPGATVPVPLVVNPAAPNPTNPVTDATDRTTLTVTLHPPKKDGA